MDKIRLLMVLVRILEALATVWWNGYSAGSRAILGAKVGAILLSFYFEV
jgi:uncharacterized membrane protein